MRDGMDITVKGVPLVLIRWEFNEDGEAGAIYFKIPAGFLNYGSNNGASHFPDPHPDDFSEPNARAATPCMEHGEDFVDRPFRQMIQEAAEFIVDNLGLV